MIDPLVRGSVSLLMFAMAVAGCMQRPESQALVCAPALPQDPRGVWVAPGTVQLGAMDFYPEERPLREEAVEGLWIDATEVTNAQFAQFVAATGYVTIAERTPLPADNPGVPADQLLPGAAVFTPASEGVDLGDIAIWWRFVPGADWRRPEGPQSTIADREDHPVVQVVLEDALAYARWRGRSIPTEAQWELAARGGHVGRDYIWGEQAYPQRQQMANTWQGVFPWRDVGDDGFAGTAPVGCFPPNDFQLYDMAGNVWEWTTSSYPAAGQDFAVIKGGSFLCSPDYCGRFRPAARQPGDRTLSTNHIGFRTVLDEPAD